ncbi:MAG: peptidoglycan DD-metalloendopeptidase family protein [Lachnospiraceae bacterium]|nr:peptidoglycan DD-metalloendopeptidase family protein [Lachnospiraceae bacterium]
MMGVMIQTAFLVIAILAVQKALGDKLHAYVRYGLWLLVVLRLLIPVNLINSPLSMLRVTGEILQSDAVVQGTDSQGDGSAEQAEALNEQKSSLENILHSTNAGMDAGNVAPIENTEKTVEGTVNSESRGGVKIDGDMLQAGKTDRSADDDVSRIDAKRLQGAVTEAYRSGKVTQIRYGIWLTGSLLVGGFLGFSHIRFRRKLRKMRTIYKKNLPSIIKKTQVPIYRVKGLETPCLVGFVRPAIYIGTDIDTISDHFRYTVTHEVVHYLHRDHIWAFVRAVLVVVYWFHPFVWLAAALSVKDGELACDYGTVRRLEQKEKFAYSEMLLQFSQIRKERRLYTYGTMLRPSKSELKRRILRLTQVNGNRTWAGILAVLLMVIAVGCAFTGADDINNGKTIQLTNEASNDPLNEGSDDNGNAVADSGESDGSGNLSDNENTENIEPRQLESKPAEISGQTLFGADGPHLDYAGGMGTDKGSRIIFHDYFGLIVYDLFNREIVRSLDLASIGCDMTQGDDYCQVVVSADGTTVWLHPVSKRYMYRYEVEENLLYQEPLVKTLELDLEAEELFDRYLSLSMEPEYTDEDTDWSSWHSNYLYEQYRDGQGLHNAYIYLWASNNSDVSDMVDSRLALRNLYCVWNDMVFILFEGDADAPDSAEIPIEEEYFSYDPTIQDSADIPEEIKHERFQDDQTDGASETADADDFPYNYQGNVVDVEIIYDKPCNYTRISDVFGGRTHPITGEVIWHEGIDYAAAEGTDIWAAADGVVYETGYSAEYGNYVVLLHINGDMTYYCHCQGVIAKKDDKVKRGDKIATVGSSGRSTGPHLHFALSRSGWFVNPEEYMEVVLDLD